MKRRFFMLMAALMTSLILTIPVGAADFVLPNVVDEAGLLTDTQWQELEQQAQSISQQYGVGVYAVAVDDYRDYTYGNLYDAADFFYQGAEEQSLILLLSMDARDYVILAYGDYAQYAFNDAGLDAMEEYFLDDFGSDDWYTGLADYVSWSADYLETAEAGNPYSAQNIPMSASQRSSAIMTRVAVIFLVPLVIAGGYILILSSRMKSVASAVEANAYVSGDLNLNRSNDLYIRTTTTRERIEKESRSGSSSGGGRGRSGKF